MKSLKLSMIVILIFVFSAIVTNAVLFYYNHISIGVAMFFMAQFIVEGASIILCYFLLKGIQMRADSDNAFTVAWFKMIGGKHGN